MNRFFEPMTKTYDAHKRFKQAWKSWSEATAKEKARAKRDVDEARENLVTASNTLFDFYLNPLRRDFESDAQAAIDDVIDFLSVDVPCFRCGYEKEWYLRRLKSIDLSDQQKQRLKSIALDLARGRDRDYRREFKEWCRLMILIADEGLLAELKDAAAGPMETGRNRPKRMLQTVLRHRKRPSYDRP